MSSGGESKRRRRHSNFIRKESKKKLLHNEKDIDKNKTETRPLERFSNAALNKFVRKELTCFVPALTIHHAMKRSFCAPTLEQEAHILKPFVAQHWCAILCLDISGFTRLSSILGAEKTKHHCSAYFKKILEVVAKYKGDTIKYLGDAIFVVWPAANSESTSGRGKVCLIAAECTAAIMAVGNYDADDIAPGTHEYYHVKLRLHCGLSCGQINYFNVGVSDHFETLVGGTCVGQLASCLNLAKHGQVVMTCGFYSAMWATPKSVRELTDVADACEQISNPDSAQGGKVLATSHYYSFKYNRCTAFYAVENDDVEKVRGNVRGGDEDGGGDGGRSDKSGAVDVRRHGRRLRRTSSTMRSKNRVVKRISEMFSSIVGVGSERRRIVPISDEDLKIEEERLITLVRGCSACEKCVNEQYYDFNQDAKPFGMVLYNNAGSETIHQTTPNRAGLEKSPSSMRSRVKIVKALRAEFDHYAGLDTANARESTEGYATTYDPTLHGPLDGGYSQSLVYRMLVRANVHKIVRRTIDEDLRALTGTMLVVTTVFVALDALIPHLVKGDLDSIQRAFEVFFGSVQEEGGAIRQFVQDDKGCVGIVVFGVPGFAYSDNASRALRFSLKVLERLDTNLGIVCSAGVTTGSVYSGLVGARHRCTWTVMGPSVNLAARLMSKAEPRSVLVDNLSYVRSSKRCVDMSFTRLEDVNAKGYSKPVAVYEPKFLSVTAAMTTAATTTTTTATVAGNSDDTHGDELHKMHEIMLANENKMLDFRRTTSVGKKMDPIIYLFELVPEQLFERYMSLSVFEQLVLKVAAVSTFRGPKVAASMKTSYNPSNGVGMSGEKQPFSIGLISSVLMNLGRRRDAPDIDRALSILLKSPPLIKKAAGDGKQKMSLTMLKTRLFAEREDKVGGVTIPRHSLDCIVDCMRDHYLFRHMKWPELVTLAMEMRPMRFMNGEIVYRQGDRLNGGFFVVEEGFILLSDGQHDTIAGPGNGFGEDALVFADGKRTSTATVIPPSVARRMNPTRTNDECLKGTIRRAASVSRISKSKVAQMEVRGGCLIWMVDNAMYIKHVKVELDITNEALEDAVYAQIPLLQRQKMHGIIAKVLEEERAEPIQICKHIMASNDSTASKIDKIEQSISSLGELTIESVWYLRQLLSLAIGPRVLGDLSTFFLAEIVTDMEGRSSAATETNSPESDVKLPKVAIDCGFGLGARCRRMHKEMLEEDAFVLPPIRRDFFEYAKKRVKRESDEAEKEEQTATTAHSGDTATNTKESPTSWATAQIAEWLVRLGKVFKEEGFAAMSFNLAQISLLYLDAPTIPIAISTSALLSCFNATIRSWSRSREVSKFSSLNTKRLLVIRSAYAAARSCLSLSAKMIERRQSMYVGKQEISGLATRGKRIVAWYEHACDGILLKRGVNLSALEKNGPRSMGVTKEGSPGGQIGRWSESAAMPSSTALTFDMITDWIEFDIFDVAGSMNTGTLFPRLFETLFDVTGFNVIRTLNISRLRLMDMLRRAELSYCDTIAVNSTFNPYHNALHGADVMCSAATIVTKLSRKHVPSEAFTPLIVFATAIASLLHDYKHLGVNNSFLEKTKHPLALRYKSGGALERMHASEALQLVHSSKCLDSFDKAHASAFDFLVTKLILCTDFSRGMKSVELVETAFRDLFDSTKNGDKGAHFQRSSSLTFDPSTVTRNDAAPLARRKSARIQGRKKKNYNVEDLTTVSSVLGLVMECADIGHPAKPLKLHQRWSVMVSKEFFAQGELEKEKGMGVSPMCDITTHRSDSLAWGRSQQGFINFLVRPKFNALSTICDDPSCWIDCMRENHSFWGSKAALTGFKRLSFEVESDASYHRAVTVASGACYKAPATPKISQGVSGRVRSNTIGTRR